MTATLLAAGWLGGPERDAFNEKGRTAVQAALRLAPTLSQGYTALGLVKANIDFDIAGAEAAQRRALELAPADAETKVWLGSALGAQGRDDEASALMQEALVLDPLRTTAYLQYVRILLGLGRFDEAETRLHRAIELQPTVARAHAFLALLHLLHERPAEALEEARREPEGFWRDYAIAMAQQKQGSAAADAALREFIARDAEQGAMQIAVLYALRKEPDRMFEWLERSYAKRDAGVWLLYNDPFVLAYRDDPRFATFAQKLGLPPLAKRPGD